MRLTTRQDIEAPLDFVYAQMADFAQFERMAMRRGAEVERSDKLEQDGPGMGWRVKFPFRGKTRKLNLRLADAHPLVIVAESLHWADKPSLDLLTELLKSSESLPILALLVTRPDERISALLEGKVRIELHGLSAEEQVRLVEARLGVKEGVRAVCAELLPRVGGNPFFLLELVDALLERGLLEIREDALVRAEDGDREFFLPQTLEQLLADRIVELAPRERLIVDWLAIAGGPLGVADLERLFAFETSARNPVHEPLGRLCERGLCDKKGTDVDFRHPLTRDVAYAALRPEARTRMHRAPGEHLAQTKVARGVSEAIVASHFARGDDGERASHFYLEAATAARTTYQTNLAVRYYKRALLQLTIDDPRRLLAHDALEGIFRMLGRKRDRVAQLEGMRACARQVASPRSVCLAFLRTARFDLDEGKLPHGLPIARKAAQIARGAGFLTLEIEAESLVSELSRELDDVQGALAAADRALAECDPNVNPNVPPRLRADALLERVGGEFVLAFLLALAFMYMILAGQFESFLQPLLILIAIPVAAPFALLSLLVTGQTMNLYSALGVLVLFGMVKKNAILQVDHTNQLLRSGAAAYDAVLQGSRDRLRPILMTTLAFVAGLLPLAVGAGPGAEERKAIAVVVIGGQLLSLGLTLVLTPVAQWLTLRRGRARP